MAYHGPTAIDHPSSTRNMASGFQGQGQGQKPLSRLQQLQIDYQAKLMREKEQKLAKMYEENQKRAMERVAQNSGRGMVRDFFNERRNIASQQSVVPNIHQHYKAKKKYEYGGPSGFQPSKPPVPPGHQPQQKNSAGRDRAHPLAPIERTKTYESGSLSDGAVINSPKPPKKQSARQSSNLKNKENSGNNLHYGSEGNINSPESNAEKQNILSGSSKARVAKYKQRKAQVFKHDIESSDEEPVRNQSKPKAKPKITDFQKWQMEQDAARERRLAAHQQQHAQNDVYDGTFDRDDGEEGGDSNDEDREEAAREEEEQEERRQEQLKKQQEEKELLRLLAKRQEELKQLQQERLRAEEEEKKQAKKEAAEKERKRRLQQAADEQRKREEEQRVWQEEQKDKEEEEGGESYGASTSNVSHFNGHSGPVHEKPITPKDVFPKKPSRVKPHPPSRPPAQRTRHQPTPNPEPEPEMDRQRSPPAAFYEEAAASAVTADDVDIEFAECSICGRKFASDRLDKHMKVCAKNASKKRKLFDPTTMRTKGTEQEKYVKAIAKKPEPAKKASNWRAQHEEFIRNLQYAKKMKAVEDAGGNLADLPPPPPTENPDYVQCPHCQRKFNETAAERHIPRCKELKTKPAKKRR